MARLCSHRINGDLRLSVVQCAITRKPNRKLHNILHRSSYAGTRINAQSIPYEIETPEYITIHESGVSGRGRGRAGKCQTLMVSSLRSGCAVIDGGYAVIWAIKGECSVIGLSTLCASVIC